MASSGNSSNTLEECEETSERPQKKKKQTPQEAPQENGMENSSDSFSKPKKKKSFSKKELVTEGHPKRRNINKMKRQRNTQQVKEQDKCPPTQTKEEEIGNLPEKEFRIMIGKTIQNLEIKMESQINSLETRIEKMQERFNKDLEEIKKESIYNEYCNK